ncbi:hypothetical protein SCH01S_35_00750 [Sphingomonas changbaiensis NBRC 104936]|uniref:Glycosyltransferase RgtA/B/C/D-like domain-containing protein n=1 Tax=Sphingomonas changbaiensis NBRC 104936 TaxID=1219043 RepID=A0A0E9MR74_9SPHN|nr:hypothetical protein [Sphingomonas changbaiensis]GAO39640.1 hypothetical protein SCH01S_35_00750 [Sphingomonas changbaiensis NBRC 104936]
MAAETRAGALQNSLLRYAAPILLALGFLIRCVWLWRHGFDYAVGEAANVAISIARDGTFADTFARGSGLSAHFTPSMTLVAGGAYAVFGVRTGAAELVLATLSIGLSLTSGYLWYRVVREIGAPRSAALVALALFCLLPMNFGLEVIAFRAWEGALAAAGAALCLLITLRLDRSVAPTWKGFTGLAIACALTFFVNQAIGLAVYGAMGLLLLRRFAVRRWPAAIGIAALCLIAALTPWTVRNAVVFDRFIPLRSNLGLELALANSPAATTGEDEHANFLARLRTIHPLESESAFRTMERAGGEIPYADALGKEAKAWIAENPGQFAALCLHHLREFYFPPAWQWNIYTEGAQAVGLRQALVWALSVLGLLGALLLPKIYGSRALYPAIFVLAPALPYLIVQPILRYRYLIFSPMLFCATILLAWIVIRALSRARPQPAG